MEWSLILLLVGFVVLVYLIFKFIKKLVFAVITVVLLVVLIFAGVGGIVYLDVNNLASQKDFDVNVVYYDRTSESYLTGVYYSCERAECERRTNFRYYKK